MTIMITLLTDAQLSRYPDLTPEQAREAAVAELAAADATRKRNELNSDLTA